MSTPLALPKVEIFHLWIILLLRFVISNGVANLLYFKYDMRSQLTSADITNIIGGDGT